MTARTRPPGILHRIPLYLKMVAVTIMVGLIAWLVSDRLQTQSLNDALLDHFAQMLDQKAKENRRLFSDYVKAYKESAKMIVMTAAFQRYLNREIEEEWTTGRDVSVKFHSEPPGWLPQPSVLRALARIPYALLLDDRQRVREVYAGREGDVPGDLLRPSQRLLRLSHGQSFLTLFDEIPFLVRSEMILDSGDRKRGMLVLASPLDTDFLIASQGVNSDHMLALVERKHSTIVASSHPHLFQPGASLLAFEHDYLIDGTDKVFFDLGASELNMQVVSFILRNQYKPIARSILLKERRLRAAGAAVLIFSFVIIMVWVTGHIRKLSMRVADYSRNRLGVRQEDEMGGDELSVLDRRFHTLIEEVESSRAALQQQAESLRSERDRAQNYLDIAGAVILALNREGAVILINKKGCEVLGYAEDEIIGRRWIDCFVPERLRADTEQIFQYLMSDGVDRTDHYERNVLTRSGDERVIAWHISRLKDKGGSVMGLLGSGEDITDRKKLEQSLLEIEDRERQRLGYELHDSLGQLLTGIAFKHKCLENSLRKDLMPEAEEVTRIGSLINEAKEQAKLLSKGLAADGVDGEGLMSALEGLALHTQRLFDISCTFSCEDPVQVRDKRAIIQLYRIAQEAVTNAVKHSQCKHIEILLAREGDVITMKVKDDGTGLPGAPEQDAGMGLKIMNYRAAMIGARLEAGGDRERGTVVVCYFPDRS